MKHQLSVPTPKTNVLIISMCINKLYTYIHTYRYRYKVQTNIIN